MNRSLSKTCLLSPIILEEWVGVIVSHAQCGKGDNVNFLLSCMQLALCYL